MNVDYPIGSYMWSQFNSPITEYVERVSDEIVRTARATGISATQLLEVFDLVDPVADTTIDEATWGISKLLEHFDQLVEDYKNTFNPKIEFNNEVDDTVSEMVKNAL